MSHLDVFDCLKDNSKLPAVKPSVGTILERKDQMCLGKAGLLSTGVLCASSRHVMFIGWSSGKVEHTTSLGAG